MRVIARAVLLFFAMSCNLATTNAFDNKELAEKFKEDPSLVAGLLVGT